MKQIVALVMCLNLIFVHVKAKQGDESEFYMNEYECIDKVLFDPKVFYVLQNQNEKACEIGVNFNLEQIFRQAEQTSLDEEGFKTILEILDGKFGVKDKVYDTSIEDEMRKEEEYNMELQQLTIEYLKSNMVKKKQLTESYENRNTEILTPELADEYMNQLKTIANADNDNFMLLGNDMQNASFQGRVDGGALMTQDSRADSETQLTTMRPPEEGRV
jgi:hypothetical protein